MRVVRSAQQRGHRLVGSLVGLAPIATPHVGCRGAALHCASFPRRPAANGGLLSEKSAASTEYVCSVSGVGVSRIVSSVRCWNLEAFRSPVYNSSHKLQRTLRTHTLTLLKARGSPRRSWLLGADPREGSAIQALPYDHWLLSLCRLELQTLARREELHQATFLTTTTRRSKDACIAQGPSAQSHAFHACLRSSGYFCPLAFLGNLGYAA